MAMLQDLDVAQIDQTIAAAIEKQVPVVLTAHGTNAWVNVHSRLLAAHNGRLLLEVPPGEAGLGSPEFRPADKIGMAFKLKHYKHVCTVVIAGNESMALPDGTMAPVVSVCAPSRMQRIQRRVFQRADVPPNRIVRATFWLGDRNAEPTGGQGDRPVWFGRVVNLSAGGLQLRSDCTVTRALEAGDSVGIRLSFGVGADEAVFVDAQFRHVEDGAGSVLLGFQFVGLEQTQQGQDALRVISAKVGEYQRLEERATAWPPAAPPVAIHSHAPLTLE
jgi:c-di-GMP-binding flagellar brake protein YcgR